MPVWSASMMSCLSSYASTLARNDPGLLARNDPSRTSWLPCSERGDHRGTDRAEPIVTPTLTSASTRWRAPTRTHQDRRPVAETTNSATRPLARRDRRDPESLRSALASRLPSQTRRFAALTPASLRLERHHRQPLAASVHMVTERHLAIATVTARHGRRGESLRRLVPSRTRVPESRCRSGIGVRVSFHE